MKSPRVAQVGVVLAFLAVFAFSINLRLGIVSLAPMLGQIRDALGVGTSAAGVFTALPGFAFAIMGWSAVPLARRLGISPALVLAGCALVAGILLRSMSSAYVPFLLCSIVVVCSLAIGNVLLPAWIQTHGRGSRRLGLMTVFTTALGLSAMIGPLSAMWFSGGDAWRQVLGVWGIPAAILVVVWLLVVLRVGRDVPRSTINDATSQHDAAGSASMWASPTAVATLVYFAMQSASFYTQVGWLPQVMMDRGVDSDTASLALVVLGGMGVLGGLIMPLVISRVHHATVLTVGISLFTLAGWAGVLWNTQAAPLLWAVVLGIGGMSFPLVLALLTARTRSPLVSARFSGFVQPNGYLVAGVIPLLIGIAYSATGSWTAPLAFLVLMAGAQAVVGTRTGRNVFIDDELNAAARGKGE